MELIEVGAIAIGILAFAGLIALLITVAGGWGDGR